MALTKVQVVSLALMKLGKKPVMTLDGQSDIVTAASAAFDFLFSAVMGEQNWRFACTIQVLSLLNFTPIGGYWTYAYELPANYTKLVHLWPQTYDFEIYENRQLFSNFNNAQQPLYLEYQFVPVVQNVPDYFWKYFVPELASFLALANAQSVEYYNALMAERDKELSIALASDAQNRPQTPLQSRPVIAGRYVSTFASG